jgi:4-hydroxy-2-oxoheptanedioate aldolase
MYRKNVLKSRLKQGENVLGCWSFLGSPHATELLGLAGFDYILIDQEHGLGDPSSISLQMQALSATEASGIVRVPWNDPIYLKRVLDAGVDGVMIPSIDTAAEATAAVAACRYPPRGRRGTAASSVRASNYGMAADYVATAADNLTIVLQIETVEGVRNIDEILAVEGIDVLFIGPYDLSGSAGHLGELKHPEVAGLIEHVEKRTRAKGIPLGTVPHQGCTWADMFDRGYQFVNAGSDIARLRDGALADIKRFREGYRTARPAAA